MVLKPDASARAIRKLDLSWDHSGLVADFVGDGVNDFRVIGVGQDGLTGEAGYFDSMFVIANYGVGLQRHRHSSFHLDTITALEIYKNHGYRLPVEE